MAALKSVCENTVEVAYYHYINPQYQIKLRTINTMSEPTSVWHTEHNRGTRSVSEDFYSQQKQCVFGFPNLLAGVEG